jgi:hypothetical protein
MTRNGGGPIGLDRLEAALDTYGADRTRWPAPLRHALSGLIAGNGEAQKLLAEAELFDRLLDQAPQYDPARIGKLRERIAAAAERQPRLVATTQTDANAARPVLRRRQGIVATALAASLVLGLFAGQTSVINSTADLILGNDNAASATSMRQIARTDDADSLLDEDLL